MMDWTPTLISRIIDTTKTEDSQFYNSTFSLVKFYHEKNPAVNFALGTNFYSLLNRKVVTLINLVSFIRNYLYYYKCFQETYTNGFHSIIFLNAVSFLGSVHSHSNPIEFLTAFKCTLRPVRSRLEKTFKHNLSSLFSLSFPTSSAPDLFYHL